ncbi:MAG: IS1 family transposase [Chitinophagaceae bacterium]|nr:IS1 family transposase [Chitinophagaceae bacterium]
MKQIACPKCKSEEIAKSGVVKGRQRFRCKHCNYFFTVMKEGKNIDAYYVIKALQLYIEGVTLREIERILGISHVSVMNWVKKYNIKAPENHEYRPTYKVLNHTELVDFFSNKDALKSAGCMITELGDKFMLIKWERFRKNTL